MRQWIALILSLLILSVISWCVRETPDLIELNPTPVMTGTTDIWDTPWDTEIEQEIDIENTSTGIVDTSLLFLDEEQ